jgi:hypothetical protein
MSCVGTSRNRCPCFRRMFCAERGEFRDKKLELQPTVMRECVWRGTVARSSHYRIRASRPDGEI